MLEMSVGIDKTGKSSTNVPSELLPLYTYRHLKCGLGSISAALSCPVSPLPEKCVRGRSAGSFPEQRLVIEPNTEHTAVKRKNPTPPPVFSASNFVRV